MTKNLGIPPRDKCQHLLHSAEGLKSDGLIRVLSERRPETLLAPVFAVTLHVLYIQYNVCSQLVLSNMFLTKQ